MMSFELIGTLQCHDDDGHPSDVDHYEKKLREKFRARSNAAGIERAKTEIDFSLSFPNIKHCRAVLKRIVRTRRHRTEVIVRRFRRK